MSDDGVMTAGQTVAQARLAAGLTVAQVAGATRVRATLVTAIENDDFRLCGGDVYARGHLRSIATAIGLDPAEAVAAFDHQRGTEHPVSAPVQPVASPHRATTASGGSLGALAGPLGVSVESGRRNGGANWTAVMALALVAVLGMATVTALANRGASNPVASPTSTPSVTPTSSATPTEQPTAQPTAQPSDSPTDTVAQADGVNVVMTITGKASWVRVTGGTAGKTLYEGTLTEGDTKIFKDDTLVKLLLGNAGAVSLVVNGRDVGVPGKSGDVVTTEFGPGDPNGQAG